MNENDVMPLLTVLVAGGVLGGAFYGGLWWTVSRVLTFRHPAVWFLSGLLLRMGVTLVGIYLLTDGQWDRLLTCMFGFVVGRMVVTRLTALAHDHPTGLDKEAIHAP